MSEPSQNVPLPASKVSDSPLAPVVVASVAENPVPDPIPVPAPPVPFTSPETTLEYHTALGHGQAIRFSPFPDNRIACAVGQEYGLEGQGYVYILEKDESKSNQLVELVKLEYRDNLYDVCWSEKEPNVLVTAAGDGFLQVWNLGNKFPRIPVHEFKGHKKEMSSLDWNLPKFSNYILAASWDGTVCTYDVVSPWPVVKMVVSELMVYQAVWSPHNQNNYISVSSDGVMQLWDMNANAQKPQIFLSASDSELLTCDWSKYSSNIVATAGSDCVIKGWDLRNYSLPLFQMEEHGHAIKRIKFSPFRPTLLASASYDLTIRLFDYHASDCNLEIIDHHSAFVYGIDWNVQPNCKNELASCAWDQTVKVFTPSCLRGL